MKSERIFNFSAGPAVLPVPVLAKAQNELMASARASACRFSRSAIARRYSKDVLARAEADVRKLANVPSNYRVLFLQGGASLQFAMVPMNLLPPEATADYVVTGVWATKAAEEARKIGKVHIAATTKAEQFARVPRAEEIVLTPGAAYVHMTSNNTIYGTEWKDLPDVGDLPLVSDTSSDMFSRPIDVSKHALIYAGAQKEYGTGGRDGCHHPRRSAGAIASLASRDVELRGPGRERLDVQHAAGVRDLHAGPGDAVADRAGAASKRSRKSTSERRQSCTRRSTGPGFIAAPRRRTAVR